MYAIVNIFGKSYKVAKNDELLIDLQNQAKEGDKLTFNTVTLYRTDKDIMIGKPYLEQVKVEAEVVNPLVKGDKITVFKYKPKVNYRVKQGHRQKYTLVKILEVKEENAKKNANQSAVAPPSE